MLYLRLVLRIILLCLVGGLRNGYNSLLAFSSSSSIVCEMTYLAFYSAKTTFWFFISRNLRGYLGNPALFSSAPFLLMPKDNKSSFDTLGFNGVIEVVLMLSGLLRINTFLSPELCMLYNRWPLLLSTLYTLLPKRLLLLLCDYSFSLWLEFPFSTFFTNQSKAIS
jgi:hypothetical protein